MKIQSKTKKYFIIYMKFLKTLELQTQSEIYDYASDKLMSQF